MILGGECSWCYSRCFGVQARTSLAQQGRHVRGADPFLVSGGGRDSDKYEVIKATSWLRPRLRRRCRFFDEGCQSSPSKCNSLELAETCRAAVGSIVIALPEREPSTWPLADKAITQIDSLSISHRQENASSASEARAARECLRREKSPVLPEGFAQFGGSWFMVCWTTP